MCAEPGFCAFDDPDCISGLAYGDLAGDSLAGMCVPAEETGSGSGSTATSAGSMSMSGATSDPTTGVTVGPSSADDTTMGAGPTSGPATSATTAVGSTTDEPTTGGSSSSDGGPVTQTASYPATYAACVMVDLMTPEPATCSSFTAPDGMTTDSVISAMMPELGGSASLIHIPVGAEFDNHEIVEVRLRLHTLPMTDSVQTGEIWVVEPFTPMSIEMALPLQLGAGPLAPNMGASLGDVDVVWVLPSDAVTANTDMYLGVFSVSNDGVDFYTHLGPSPPVIEVEYLP